MPRIVKKAIERRKEIIQAAQELFLKHDYATTTMQDCIQYIGIAKGTIYHYFKSKEELLAAVVTNLVEESMQKIPNILAATDMDALSKLQAVIESCRIAAPTVLDKLHTKGNEALHLRLLVAALMQQAPVYAAIIKQGCQEGIFNTNNHLECAELILAGIQFLTDLGIHAWTETEISRRVKAFPALIEQLLQAPRGSFKFLFK